MAPRENVLCYRWSYRLQVGWSDSDYVPASELGCTTQERTDGQNRQKSLKQVKSQCNFKALK